MSYLDQQAALATALSRKKKVSPRVAKSVLLAIATENPGGVQGGDRDSEGPLQQRPSQGWGPASESDSTDISQYLDRAMAANRGFKGSAGQLAQTVQRSAFPDRYDQHSSWADKLLGSSSAPDLSNVSRIASSLGQTSGTSQASPAQPTVYDVIRRYRDATTPQPETAVGTPFDSAAATNKIQDTVQQIIASRTPAAAPGITSPVASLGAMPSGKKGKVEISPTANRPGVGMQKGILNFLDQVAGVAGRPIKVGTGTNHSQMTTSGNVSDHWDGNGADLEVGGDARQSKTVEQNGDLLAAHAIEVAGGMPFEKALAMARKGGLWNFNTPKGRIQVIWKTMTGGNHYNHVHTGLNPGR